jgi:hypothetical protein
MMRSARAPAVSVLAFLALVCATSGEAVGATGKAAYERQMKDPGAAVAASLRSLTTATGMSLQYPPKSTAARDIGALLTKSDASLGAAVTRIKQITPPATAATAHAKLISAAVQLTAQLKPVIAKLRLGYLVAASKLLTLTGAKNLSLALTNLNKLGYRIGVT